MTIEELKSLESLNEFRLTQAEEEKMMALFDSMNRKEAALGELDTENVEVMVHCMPMVNVFREDERVQHFERNALLEGAPEHNDESWIVPRLVK